MHILTPSEAPRLESIAGGAPAKYAMCYLPAMGFMTTILPPTSGTEHLAALGIDKSNFVSFGSFIGGKPVHEYAHKRLFGVDGPVKDDERDFAMRNLCAEAEKWRGGIAASLGSTEQGPSCSAGCAPPVQSES